MKKQRDMSPGVMRANLSANRTAGSVGGAHGHVGQLEHLLVGGVGNLGTAIAHVLEPEARHGVDVGVAQGIGHPAALAPGENLWLALLGHVAGLAQVNPQVLQGRLL